MNKKDFIISIIIGIVAGVFYMIAEHFTTKWSASKDTIDKKTVIKQNSIKKEQFKLEHCIDICSPLYVKYFAPGKYLTEINGAKQVCDLTINNCHDIDRFCECHDLLTNNFVQATP